MVHRSTLAVVLLEGPGSWGGGGGGGIVRRAHLCHLRRLPQDAPADPAPQAHGKPKRGLESHYLAITAFIDLSYAPRDGEIRQLRSCQPW